MTNSHFFLNIIPIGDTQCNGDIMKDRSIWLDDINVMKNKFPQLKENIECDVLIIGGGITGISTAYFLSDDEEKIVLVEANKICQGTTAKSTGKLTYLQGDVLNKIKNYYDDDTYLNYLASQKEAIRLAKKIIIDNDIKCDLEPVNSYVYTNKTLGINTINSNYRILKKYANIKLKKHLPIPLKCERAIEANDTFVFHPVKFVLSLTNIIKNKINIYENTRILGIDKENDFFIAHTKNGQIRAKKIVLACHYPFFIKPYYFPFRTTVEKSFLVASEVDKTRSFSAINIDRDVLSMRYHKNYKNYMIIASESASLSKNIDNVKKRDDIIWKMRTLFSPNIKYCWSNHDILTSDGIPLIGEIEPHLYLATGYNTWGMTNGILAGKLISDALQKRYNPYSELFNPLRDEKGIPSLIGYNIINGYSFLNTKLVKNKKFYHDDVQIINEKGIDYGLYIDENKKIHKVYNQCPHMKCSLAFNYQTKTWDCPCHGSSFDIDGNVIYGPSKDDIKIRDSDQFTTSYR